MIEIAGYRLLELLGKGGMGEVYAAERMGSAERVAVKIFTCDGSRKEFLRKRFLAEGRLLHHLNHPRLVKVSEIEIDPQSDTPYYVMDLVSAADGKSCTLEDWRQRGEFDETDVARVYSELREALLYLESQGVVHRDVKLENVLIDADGHVRLADFGVSRIFDEDLRRKMVVTTTFAGDHAPIMGSMGYLAPELREGAIATAASDAWALGVLVFRLLTGVWYESGTAAEEWIAGFDEGWQKVLRRLLNVESEKRLPIPEFRPARRKFKRKSIFGGTLAAALLGIGLWFGLGARANEQLKNIELDLGTFGKLEFVACPTGSVDLVTHWRNGETRSVVLSEPYWITRYPITRRESAFYPPLDPKAVEISEDEMNAYVCLNHLQTEALTRYFTTRFAKVLPEGYEIRLPTLAEWERAFHADATDPRDPYADLTHIHVDDEVTEAICHNYDRKDQPRTKRLNAWGIGDWCGQEKVFDTFTPDELEKSGYEEHPQCFHVTALPQSTNTYWYSTSSNRVSMIRMPFWVRWAACSQDFAEDWCPIRLVIGPKLPREEELK